MATSVPPATDSSMTTAPRANNLIGGEPLLSLAQRTDSVATGTTLSPQNSQYVAGRDLAISHCQGITIGEAKPKSSLVDYAVPIILTLSAAGLGMWAWSRGSINISGTISKG